MNAKENKLLIEVKYAKVKENVVLCEEPIKRQ